MHGASESVGEGMPSMKTLLINAPIRLEARPNCIPYGLATVAAVLRERGHEVKIYDANALRPDARRLEQDLLRAEWDIAGVSGLVTTFSFQVWIIERLKAMNPQAPVVSGGGLATSIPRLLFKNAPLDFAVLGEGEETMAELVETLERGDAPLSVQGLAYREEGRVRITPPRPNIPDLDTVPFPAWDLLPMEVYLPNPVWGGEARNSSGFPPHVRVSRSMNVISSRGCPFACEFCYHLFGRSHYRFRSAENVAAEVEQLVDRYGVDFVGFVDDNMMASEKRLLEFCDLLERRKLPITWGCHARVTSAKPDILQRMAETGCVWIGYGIESGSQRILDAMNKKVRVEEARRAVLRTRQAGMFANTTFIFGYPGETLETIQETIDFKKSLGIRCGSFFATPYPGTPLYEKCRDRIPDEETYILSLGNATQFTVNLTDFEEARLFRLKQAMDENSDVLERPESVLSGEPTAGYATK